MAPRVFAAANAAFVFFATLYAIFMLL